MSPSLTLENPDRGPQALSDADADVMIARLETDPDAVRELFPRVADAPPAQLPTTSDKRPLVLIPKADGWSDS
jgi:hypothetical protein